MCVDHFMYYCSVNIHIIEKNPERKKILQMKYVAQGIGLQFKTF